ncbi:MAG TPA: peptidase T [Pseudogracilibacillus sp.]|nr:peptidase T [Pseudogracilibacillus sp.]
MKEKLIKRLTSYAKIDTQSDEASTKVPTTEGQLLLAENLVKELTAIGMSEVTIDDNGYVMATLPANTNKTVPTIGFLAHLDTATDYTGKDVQPQIHHQYDGKEIVLNEAKQITMDPSDFPELKNYIGHTLMTTDGTTLLGADNKAGIAEIITAMEYLIEHPEIKHGKIRVAFTPDEEIGRGPHHFDVEAFSADLAYTVDGGPLGELQYESFNAAAAKLFIKGNNVHPGTAKGKMIHSVKIAQEIMNALPVHEAPEFTDGYEGFYHLIDIKGSTEETEMYYIIRDFDRHAFQDKKQTLRQITEQLNEKYGKERISLTIEDQYYNMREKIEEKMEVVDIAKEAMTNLQIKPIIEPIRGGTDGSQLSFMGLPTPNIFTGGENFHGKNEFISIENMEKSTDVIIEICRLFEMKASK